MCLHVVCSPVVRTATVWGRSLRLCGFGQTAVCCWMLWRVRCGCCVREWLSRRGSGPRMRYMNMEDPLKIIGVDHAVLLRNPRALTGATVACAGWRVEVVALACPGRLQVLPCDGPLPALGGEGSIGPRRGEHRRHGCTVRVCRWRGGAMAERIMVTSWKAWTSQGRQRAARPLTWIGGPARVASDDCVVARLR